MARALSQDLRDRVVAATDEGMSCRAAAARFGVGVATAIRWRQLAREHGRAIAGKPGGDQRSSKTDVHADRIMAILTENGDITLAEFQSALAGQGVHVGRIDQPDRCTQGSRGSWRQSGHCTLRG